METQPLYGQVDKGATLTQPKNIRQSRIVAWTFMTMKQEEVWIKSRWG